MPKWKGQKLRYLHAQKKKGVWYTYYRRDGRYVPIDGEPGTSAWMKSYTAIHDGWCAEAPGVNRDSFEAVADAYCDHREFKATSAKNQTRRRQHLDVICKGWGKINIRRITRGNVISLRDLLAEKHSPAYARECMATIKALFNFAHDRDLVDSNVAQKIKNPVGYKADPHTPWTDEQIETFLDLAPDRWRRAVMVLLHTGLRLGDAVRIRRQDISDGAIYWETSKRETDVVIPLTQALQDELSRPIRIESMYLIAGLKGGSMESHSVGNGIRIAFRKLGLGKAPPIHGLRKNAIMNLIEAGCTPREVQALTGQSLDVIEHYAQGYNREHLAKAAIVKLEKKC